MPYIIKRTKDGMYVARPGSKRSYTRDRSQAAEFATAQEAQKEACLEGESIWYDFEAPRLVSKEAKNDYSVEGEFKDKQKCWY